MSDLSPDGACVSGSRPRRPLEGAQRRRNGLRFGSSLCSGAGGCGSSLALGLELRGDTFGRCLFRHRTFSRGAFRRRAFGSGAFGSGAFGREPLGRGTLRREPLRRSTFGSLLRRNTFCLSAVCFRAHLRGQPLGLDAFRSGAICGGLFRRCAELLFGASLFCGATALDRALHRGAFLVRASLFLRASLLCDVPLFLNATFVLGAALRARTLFGEAARRGRALLFDATLGRRHLGSRPIRDSALRCGALFRSALLFLSATFLCGEPLLDGSLHCGVLRGGALLLFGTALLRDPSLLRGALRSSAILGCPSLVKLARFRRGGSTLCRGAFGGSTLFGRALLSRAPLCGCALRRLELLCGA